MNTSASHSTGSRATPERGRHPAHGPTPEEELVYRMAACPPGPERHALRERAITAFLPVARRIARRYAAPADSWEDLYQVACVGLVQAVDRYDPGRGHAFLSYAVPTIDGEIKRHLRDHTWEVHVPRRIQDRRRRVRMAQDELRRNGDEHGGSVRDLELLTGMAADEIQLALRADQARRPLSMDEPRGPGKAGSLGATLGAEDPDLERATDIVALAALIPGLPARERAILRLYFFGSLTQREVADALGISQMHVSRLLNRTCASLRRSLLAG